MSILANYLINHILGAGQQEDPALAKENRSAYRQQLQKAFDAGDENRINALIPEAMKAGVDVGPYRVKPSPEAQISNQFTQMLAEKLGLRQPQQPSAFERQADTAYDIPVNAQEKATQGPATAAMQSLQKIFTPEYAALTAAKMAGGITVSEHALTDQAWFKDYAALPESLDASSKKELLASKYGYIPMQASQLKDLSIDERKAITQSAITKFLTDPDVEAAFKRAFPNGDDKAKLGIILSKLIGDEGMPIPDHYQPFLDRFLNLRDDIIAMKGAETANEAYSRAIGQERGEAETFGGKLGREQIKAQVMRQINKPYVDADTLTKIGVGKDFLNLANRVDKIILDYVVTDTGKIDLDRLPVGPLEAWRKRADKYGIDPDEPRIRLRTAILKQVELMYQIRGKQLSDKEVALGQELQNSMNETPTQFVTKYDEFQKNLISGVVNRIEIEKSAGRDIAGLEDLKKELESRKTISEKLTGVQGPQSTQYEKNKTYRDAQGNRAKYLGDGKWQKVTK